MTDESKPFVLVAEDVRAIAVTIRSCLGDEGIEVEVVEDGRACLDRLEERLPDLLILDLMMPKMHGIDVLKVLRSHPRTAGLPVIVCTSKEFTTEMRHIDELGVIDTIIKPFHCTEFVATVTRHLGLESTAEEPEAPTGDAGADNAAEPAADDSGGTEAPAAEASAASLSEYHPHLDATRPTFILWGTRGSIPVSGPRYVRYGGNTSCMSLDLGPDIVIVDAGSGIRDIGNELVGSGKRIHLFISHTHWDHIQGFPFFTPAYLPGTQVVVYGERGFGKNLESVLRGQLDSDYFPVQFEDMHADIRFEYLDDEPVQVGPARVSREYVHHPGATVGYRIEIGGKSLVYISDNEFLQGYLGAPGDLAEDDVQIEPHRRTLEFATGADILLHEAQYTNDEYPTKVGWGHSCLSNACLFAKITRPKRWIVLHHDPGHDDEFLDRKAELTEEILASIDCTVPFDYGYDGMHLQW